MNEFEDLLALIKSRTSLILIESREETRVVELLKQVSLQARLLLYQWTVTDGLSVVGQLSRNEESCTEPTEILRHIYSLKLPGVFCLLDYHPYLSDQRNVRLLKEIVQSAERYRETIVLLSHQIELPDELRPSAARFEIQLPN